MAPFLPGYKIIASDGGADVAHHSGGKVKLIGAISPNTGAPLHNLLTLDMKDLRLPRVGNEIGLLPFLYSWTCGIYQGDFVYRVHDGRIEILEYAKGLGEFDFPYERYPETFAEAAIALVEVTKEEESIIAALNRGGAQASPLRQVYPTLDQPFHQLGGILRTTQPLDAKRCPRCANILRPYVSMANALPGGDLQTDNDFVHVVFSICTACAVVSAMNFCD